MPGTRAQLETARRRGEKQVARLEALLRNGTPPEKAVIIVGLPREIREDVVAAIRGRMQEIEEREEGDGAFNE